MPCTLAEAPLRRHAPRASLACRRACIARALLNRALEPLILASPPLLPGALVPGGGGSNGEHRQPASCDRRSAEATEPLHVSLVTGGFLPWRAFCLARMALARVRYGWGVPLPWIGEGCRADCVHGYDSWVPLGVWLCASFRTGQDRALCLGLGGWAPYALAAGEVGGVWCALCLYGYREGTSGPVLRLSCVICTAWGRESWSIRVFSAGKVLGCAGGRRTMTVTGRWIHII